MRTRWLLLATLAGAALSVHPAPARADGVYVTITGQSQGRFHGPLQYQGRLLGLVFDDISIAQSHGTPPVPRYRAQFEWGSALPQLQQAVTSGEPLDVRFEFFTPSGGHDQVYYVIEMTNARATKLTLDFDASAAPAATMTADFEGDSVAYSDPAAPPASSGSTGRLVAARPVRATPAISLAQSRGLMRAMMSPTDPPPVAQSWLTISGGPLAFHSEVAGPPAKTAQITSFHYSMERQWVPRGTPSAPPPHSLTLTKGMGSASADFQQVLHTASRSLGTALIEFTAPVNGQPRVVLQFQLAGARLQDDQAMMAGGSGTESMKLRWTHLTSTDLIGHTSAQDSGN